MLNVFFEHVFRRGTHTYRLVRKIIFAVAVVKKMPRFKRTVHRQRCDFEKFTGGRSSRNKLHQDRHVHSNLPEERSIRKTMRTADRTE